MIDTTYIPSPNGIHKRVKKNGNTQDIINSIQSMETFFDPDFCKFAQQFGNGIEGLKKLWRFVKYDIKYAKDDFKVSKQQSPLALWKSKRGDCKSKTIFINAVLRCLGIKYLTRYTNYRKSEKDVKHVYTVAIIDNKEIPIDSVYDVFGSEKPYNKKIDYPMTEIVEISGIIPTNKERAIKRPVRSKLEQSSTGPYITTFNNRPNCLRSSAAAFDLKEIKEKQQYVEKPADIKFQKISEGQAIIEIAIRELNILKVMRPEIKRIADKGLKMLYAARKGNFCPTGDIPKSLEGTYLKIKAAEKYQNIKANSFGIGAKKMRNLEGEVYGDHHDIGAFPERLCMKGLWFFENQGNFTSMVEPMSKNYGFCSNDPYGYDPSLKQIVDLSTGLPDNSTYGDRIFLFYGRNSKYKESLRKGIDAWDNTWDSLTTGANPVVSGRAGFSGWFNNQADFDFTKESFAQNSSVLSDFLNDIFAANAVDTPNGTAGSGLLYTFADGITVNGYPVNLNRLPGTALSKRGFQNEFLDATNLFSNVSRSSVQGLARNGILFDNANQPEYTLEELLAIYEERANISNIGDFGISAAIIAAIAAAVVGIISAVADAVAKCKLADNEARLIDDSAADTARFSPLGASQMPGQDDFVPLRSQSNLDSGQSSNTALLFGAAALGGYALLGNKKKKKK